jgi:peptidoglycan/xylan/chitin deacetylase (PgdA/CDA1 family)
VANAALYFGAVAARSRRVTSSTLSTAGIRRGYGTTVSRRARSGRSSVTVKKKRRASVPEFEAMLRRQFDTLYREGETIPRVMAIAVHPFVTGQPHRIEALDAALEYICSHAGVWRATGWEIVQHFLAGDRTA